MTALKLLCIILCLAGTLTVLTKKTFDELIPVILMGSAVTCYITGFCGNLMAGCFVLLAVALAFPAYCVFCICRKRSLKDVFARLATPGALVWVAVYIAIFFINRNSSLKLWDELMQWGPFVREMVRTNRLFSSEASAILIHKAYYPMFSIVQTILCKISGSYQERYLFIALQLLGVSFFIPALKNYSWKSLKSKYDKLSLAGIALLILLFPLVFDAFECTFYTSVYVDCVMGMSFGFALYLCFTNDDSRFGWISLIITSTFLILEKDHSIVLFAFVAVMAFLRLLVRHFVQFQKEVRKSGGNWRYACANGAIPLLFWLSYRLFLRMNHVSESFKTSFRLKVLFEVLLGRDHSELSSLYKAFLKNLLFEPINNYALNMNLQLSYAQLALFMCALLLVFAMLFPQQKNSLFLMSGYIGVMAVGWAFAILNVFLFVFPPRGGGIDYAAYLTAYCYHRYLSSAVVGFAFFCCTIFLHLLKSNRNWKSLLIAGILVLAVLFPSGSRYRNLFHEQSFVASCNRDVNFLMENTEPASGIYIISPQTENTVPMYLYYKLLPKYCDPYGSLQKDFQKYEYAYVYAVDDTVLERFGDCFESRDSIVPQSLYKIVQNGEGFLLVYIATINT